MLVSACGGSTASPPDARTPYVPPRLVGVGAFATTYDGDGFPSQLDAVHSTSTFVWQGDQLTSATSIFNGMTTLTTTATYDGGRLAGLASTCSGICEHASRNDTFAYDADGRLVTWTATGYGTGGAYSYDADGRVISIDDMWGNDRIVYADGSCPSSVLLGGTTPARVRYDGAGRLDDRTGITYNDAGDIAQFGDAAIAFAPLTYAPGVSSGLDPWPGPFNNGFREGFPVRGELFRLDGSCDPSMSSQPTILALALAAIAWEDVPAPGT